MALAAHAACRAAPGFLLDTLFCHFLAAPSADIPLEVHTQCLSDAHTPCTRLATLTQAGRTNALVTCSFVRPGSGAGPSMTHSVRRESSQSVQSITLDDMAVCRSDIGPYLRVQRLPLVELAPRKCPSPSPGSLLYTSAAQVTPLGSERDSINIHRLALILISDTILHCPPTVHGLTFGVPAIDDHERKPMRNAFRLMTSVNHSIRFCGSTDLRADDLVYTDSTCPWSAEQRAQIDSRMFTADGKLLAVCEQEARYVLKDAAALEGERSFVIAESKIPDSKL